MSKIKSYFDRHAHQHAYHNDPAIYHSIITHIKKVSTEDNHMILDVGCGDGPFIKSAIGAGINANFIGMDVSLSMIRIARKTFSDSRMVDLVVADAFKLPISSRRKFDVIHIDSVLHHLIGDTRAESCRLVKKLLKLLTATLSENGSIVIEEVYYNSYLKPKITSSIIFYGCKVLNFLKLDIHKIIKEFTLGLEVNFLYDKEIEKLLEHYGFVKLIKKTPWPVPRLYKPLFLKDYGHISFMVRRKSNTIRNSQKN